MTTRTFIPWYGGKHKMAADLLCFIPHNRIETYVEVFGGGMRVLINKPFSPNEVYNDMDKGLVSIFKCMKSYDTARRFQNELLKKEYSQEVFMEALGSINKPDQTDLERAVSKFILITQSFNSACNNWRKPTSTIQIETYNRRINNMLDFVPRFSSITIENLDFEELIDKYDSEKTFFYLDPPYVGDTRGAPKVYEHEGDDSLHVRMVDKLINTKGMALVSGYDHNLYDRISKNNWKKIKLGSYAKSSQMTKNGEEKDKGEEFIWKNY